MIRSAVLNQLLSEKMVIHISSWFDYWIPSCYMESLPAIQIGMWSDLQTTGVIWSSLNSFHNCCTLTVWLRCRKWWYVIDGNNINCIYIVRFLWTYIPLRVRGFKHSMTDLHIVYWCNGREWHVMCSYTTWGRCCCFGKCHTGDHIQLCSMR